MVFEFLEFETNKILLCIFIKLMLYYLLEIRYDSPSHYYVHWYRLIANKCWYTQ